MTAKADRLQARWPWRRILAGVLVSAMAGCNVAGLLSQAIPKKVKAQYRLPENRTLVLVDDPDGTLHDPSLPRTIAVQIGDALIANRAIGELVPPDRIDALMVQLGEDWKRAGVDQIGATLDAEQVVYLHVSSASLYPQPGLLEPQAEAWVKVIDVVNRKRLFPSTGSSNGSQDYLLTPKGHRLTVKLLPRGAGEQNPKVDRLRRRKLARRIARDAARLFYDHLPRQPGEPFE